ncbi:hypothetical protein HDU82_005329 [Entophlyctis luteolus]|nr:hypothetical protein HDU82_005329 [Entophlyctis luteolus]
MMARTPLASALMLYVNQKYEACVTKCTDILSEDPQNEAAWLLKTRSLTKLSDPLRQVSIEDDSSFDPSLNSARLPVSSRSETSLVGALFEYTFQVLKNIPKALELAAIAAQTSE